MAYRNYGYRPEEVRAYPVPVVSMWHRFAASLVDSLVTFGFVFGLALLAFLINGMPGTTSLINGEDYTIWVLNGVGILVAAIYHIGFWTVGGQTLGKMALGIRVVDENNQPPSLFAACLRYIGYLFCNFVVFGFLAVAFDKRKQGWHDKMANTFVVRANVEVPPGAQPVFLYPSESNTMDMMGVALYFFSVCILPCILVFALSALYPDLYNALP